MASITRGVAAAWSLSRGTRDVASRGRHSHGRQFARRSDAIGRDWVDDRRFVRASSGFRSSVFTPAVAGGLNIEAFINERRRLYHAARKDSATNARLPLDKPAGATCKSLIILSPWLSLNQRASRSRISASKKKLSYSTGYRQGRRELKRSRATLLVIVVAYVRQPVSLQKAWS